MEVILTEGLLSLQRSAWIHPKQPCQFLLGHISLGALRHTHTEFSVSQAHLNHTFPASSSAVSQPGSQPAHKGVSWHCCLLRPLESAGSDIPTAAWLWEGGRLVLGGPPAGCVLAPWSQEPPSFQCDLNSSRSCSLFMQRPISKSLNANSQPAICSKQEYRGSPARYVPVLRDSESRVGTAIQQTTQGTGAQPLCPGLCREEPSHEGAE